MRLLNLSSMPILEQLHLEEALLRADSGNWCLVNTGAPPAIVLGISGKSEKLVDLEKVRCDRIPLIRRFSGGGTVYIDPDTVFVTLIFNVDDVGVKAQPQSILNWTEPLYRPLFKGFHIEENDYVFGNKKFGGNAQYIQKGRWLHHTSFLWDYNPSKMQYLLLPDRRPKYREGRMHNDFLCSLRSYFNPKKALVNSICSHLLEYFQGKIGELSEVREVLSRPHRKSSRSI